MTRKRAMVYLWALGAWCFFLTTAFISGLSKKSDSSFFERILLLVLFVAPAVYGFIRIKRMPWEDPPKHAFPVVAKKREFSESEMRLRQKAFLQSAQRKSTHAPFLSAVTGGSGTNLKQGDVCVVRCDESSLVITNTLDGAEYSIPYSEVIKLEISGPGTVVTNAGVIGGGFGLKGAMEGMLVAAAINTMTTKKLTTTFVQFSTKSSEIHVLVNTMEPQELRLALSPAFVVMEASRHAAS
jgi:hypothetical protein